MSCTEIFTFDKDGNSECYAEIQNSFRSALTIWDMLGKKYCGHGVSLYNLEQMKEIWNLVDDNKVYEHERIVLFTTLDKCLVRKENLPRVIEAFSQFEGDTSLGEQVGILESIYNSCDDCIAVGWHQNNVSCDRWIEYNCLTGDEHYYLFDELAE